MRILAVAMLVALMAGCAQKSKEPKPSGVDSFTVMPDSMMSDTVPAPAEREPAAEPPQKGGRK